MAPPNWSEAMRSGAVFSTRAISASAGRRSAVGRSSRRGSDAGGGFSCEGIRKTGLLMAVCSSWGGRYGVTSKLPRVVMVRNGQVPFEPGEPVLKTHGAEPGILARCERTIVQLCSEKPGMDVGDDLAWVLGDGQVLPGKIIEAERFRSGQFND